MGCLGWVLIALFGGLAFAAIKVVNYSIKKVKKPLGILISILLGGICLGLGYDLAYVGWTENEVVYPYQVTYQYTYPVAGWIGMVIGGGIVIGGILRTLTMTKEQVELEELAEKPKEESSNDEDREPRS